jgi:hypothetical protein
VIVVEPVLALEALEHEFVTNNLFLISLFTIAVNVEERVIVLIFVITVVLFNRGKLAAKGHP